MFIRSELSSCLLSEFVCVFQLRSHVDVLKKAIRDEKLQKSSLEVCRALGMPMPVCNYPMGGKEKRREGIRLWWPWGRGGGRIIREEEGRKGEGGLQG